EVPHLGALEPRRLQVDRSVEHLLVRVDQLVAAVVDGQRRPVPLATNAVAVAHVVHHVPGRRLVVVVDAVDRVLVPGPEVVDHVLPDRDEAGLVDRRRLVGDVHLESSLDGACANRNGSAELRAGGLRPRDVRSMTRAATFASSVMPDDTRPPTWTMPEHRRMVRQQSRRPRARCSGIRSSSPPPSSAAIHGAMNVIVGNARISHASHAFALVMLFLTTSARSVASVICRPPSATWRSSATSSSVGWTGCATYHSWS